MPKCRQCEYLVKEKGEYGDEYCIIFGYDTPDKYIAWQGEGCRCSKKTLKKFCEENLKAEQRYAEENNKIFEEIMIKEEPYLYE